MSDFKDSTCKNKWERYMPRLGWNKESRVAVLPQRKEDTLTYDDDPSTESHSTEGKNLEANSDVPTLCYDMEYGRWIDVQPFPLNLRLTSCCLNNKTVYLSGGYDHELHLYSNEVFVAKIKNKLESCVNVNNWNLLHGGESNMMQPRCGHASIVFQDKLWVAGGRIAGVQGIVSSVESFDFRTQLWSTSADMVSSRLHFKIFEVNKNMYAVGGDRSANCLPLPLSIEKYDTQSKRWVRVGCLQEASVDFKSSRVVGSKIVVTRSRADGAGRNGPNDDIFIWTFDILTESWECNPQQPACSYSVPGPLFSDSSDAGQGLRCSKTTVRPSLNQFSPTYVRTSLKSRKRETSNLRSSPYGPLSTSCTSSSHSGTAKNGLSAKKPQSTRPQCDIVEHAVEKLSSFSIK